jgi:hypothetical protein
MVKAETGSGSPVLEEAARELEAAGRSHSLIAAMWTVASQRSASLSCRVATARSRLSRLMPHSTAWRALYSSGPEAGGRPPHGPCSCRCGPGRESNRDGRSDAVTACHLRLPPRLAQFRNRPSYAGVLQ